MNILLNPGLSLAEIPKLHPDLRAGMHSPRVVELRPQWLYKFSSQKVPANSRKASPWWFTEQEFEKVKRFFSLDKANPGFIGRIQAAVRYDWSDMDLLLTYQLTRPIKAFQGPGTWQVERTQAGSTIVYQAPPDLLQTYIPGLKNTPHCPANREVENALIPIGIPLELPGPDAVDRAIMNASGKTVYLSGNPTLH